MASELPRKGTCSQPAWQKTLFSVPEEQRCESQSNMIDSIQRIDFAVSAICDHGSRDTLDITDLNIVKALGEIVNVAALNGSFACLKYYSEKYGQMQSYLSIVTTKILDRWYNTNHPEPESIFLGPCQKTLKSRKEKNIVFFYKDITSIYLR